MYNKGSVRIADVVTEQLDSSYSHNHGLIVQSYIRWTSSIYPMTTYGNPTPRFNNRSQLLSGQLYLVLRKVETMAEGDVTGRFIAIVIGQLAE